MEPTLMVVGLNYRTAPMAVRERFWIGENRRYEALVQLSRAEGIEEVNSPPATAPSSTCGSRI